MTRSAEAFQEKAGTKAPKKKRERGPKGERRGLVRRLEPLNAAAPVGIGDIEIAAGIDGEAMTVGEITELMPGTAEAG